MQNLIIKEYKNKYRLAAEQIKEYLGDNNYSNVYNCMTRFRTNITDKAKVNLDEIKKISLVKGINWNGNELQIIIGGEVYKVVDEFKNLKKAENKKEIIKNDQILIKPKRGKRTMMAITGIVGPILMVLMASGMLQALQTILQQAGAIEAIRNVNDIPKVDVLSGTFFILSKMILSCIGIFFIWSTVKYFNGNISFALVVGILLVARWFYPTDAGTNINDASIGDWVNSSGKSGWLLFSIGSFPIVVGGYEGSVLPFVMGGFLIIWLDKWVKKWMPAVVDIIFRGAVVIFITMVGLWFIFAPILGLIEYGLFQALKYFAKIPYGFGSLIIGTLWQPLVITGCHVPIATMFNMEVINNGFSVGGAAIMHPAAGQMGAAIGVALITKNAVLKKAGFGTSVAGIFGITEPMIYGVNLPKIRPFLFACVGAGVAGMLNGLFGVVQIASGGMGFLKAITMGPTWKEQLLSILFSLIALSVALVLTYFFYQERVKENKVYNKTINKLAKLLFKKPTKEQILNLKTKYNSNINKVHELKHDYLKLEKYYGSLSKYKSQLMTLEDKESKIRTTMYKKLLKWQKKLTIKPNDELLNKFNKLNDKYEHYDLSDKKTEIQEKYDKFVQDNEKFLTIIKEKQNAILVDSYNLTDAFMNSKNKFNLNQINNMFYNAIKSVEIGFNIEEAKNIAFAKNKKGEINHEKNNSQ